MAKVFNVTAACIPEKHYMVNIEKHLEAIKKLVDEGMYFAINRARQYGKTTTLRALETYLQADYHVVFMDFQKKGLLECLVSMRMILVQAWILMKWLV